MDWLKGLFGDGVSGVVKTLSDSVATFVDTPEKKAAFEMAKRQAELDVQKLAFQADQEYLKDRQSAREMYGKDNSVQKIFALTFLIGYVLISLALLIIVVGWIGANGITIPEWASMLIGTIFGAMSQKVGTVTDFYFGSSQGSQDKNGQVQEAMKRIPNQ